MRKFVHFGLAAAVAMLAGCDSFQGTLVTSSTFNVRDKPRVGREKVVQIPTGTHFMKVSAGSSTNVKIDFQSGGSVGFKLPKVDPQRNGNQFYFPAAQIRQDFDVAGTVAQHTQDGPVETRYETCVYDSYRVPVCRRYCDDRRCWDQCYYETRYIYGERSIQGFNRFTTHHLTVQIRPPGRTTALARYTGRTEAERSWVQTAAGPCRR